MTRLLTTFVLVTVALGASAASFSSGAPVESGASQTAKPGSLVLKVTTESGGLLGDAVVRATGPVDRGGTTGSDGVVTLQNMPAGGYRVRIVRDGYHTLDKEVTIRAGGKLATEAVLSAAPPPPPPPPAPKPEASPTPPPGEPRVLSVAELAEEMLKDPQPLVEREIGCSAFTATRLIVARENIVLHRHADADEVIYVVAGEALLTVGGQDQVIGPGWYGLTPRGTSHSFTRRGRNPMVLLSIQSGPPC
jgi:mannose-6-phosphate isomerase-like protein (cupin superfamily)